MVSRLKRVRFGPVFMTSDLPMGRWREMGQGEVNILSEEVGLKPVALPELKTRTKEKIERMQRKAAKPVRNDRRPRVLRPADEADVRSESPRAPRDTGHASRDLPEAAGRHWQSARAIIVAPASPAPMPVVDRRPTSRAKVAEALVVGVANPK